MFKILRISAIRKNFYIISQVTVMILNMINMTVRSDTRLYQTLKNTVLGHIGIKQFVGRNLSSDLQPGLHYALPWPFGSIIPVSEGDVRSMTIGSSRSGQTRSSGQNLWFEIVNTRAHRDNTNYIQTGDENLIFLELDLQYRFIGAADLFHGFQDLDELVRYIAENG